MLVEITTFTHASVAALNRDLKNIKETFFKVDIISAIFTSFVSFAALGARGAKSTADLAKVYKGMLGHVGLPAAATRKITG